MSQKERSLTDFYSDRAKLGGWIFALISVLGIIISHGNSTHEPDTGIKFVISIMLVLIFGHFYLAFCQLCAEVKELRKKLGSGTDSPKN